jgi:CRP/FNR family transcriptional regulator, cyclic AMP receptor protein
MADESLANKLRANPWYAALAPEHFDQLAELAQAVAWQPGQVIFREGDPDNKLYLVLEGQVALDMLVPPRGRVTILSIGPNELFGWSAVVPGITRKTASARAVRATRAVAYDTDALRAACEADPVLGFHVYRRLTNVIAGRLSATRLQLLDMYAAGHRSEPI